VQSQNSRVNPIMYYLHARIGQNSAHNLEH